MYRLVIAVMVSVTLAPIAQAQSADDPYTIMKPEPGRKPQPPLEPWLPPKYQSPRGTKQHIETRKPAPAPRLRAPTVPPPMYVPETGRLLPNLPARPGSDSGPNGAEHRQDRAVRCAHQAGLYGEAAGNRAAYIGSCINQ
jgi:hypothetical protein